jgi:hypothetical protein
LPIDCQAAANSTKQVLIARAPKRKIVGMFFFPDVYKEVILQIAIKAINNIIRLNKLMLMLFIFGLYLKIIN